jgi:hypothetical protein
LQPTLATANPSQKITQATWQTQPHSVKVMPISSA